MPSKAESNVTDSAGQTGATSEPLLSEAARVVVGQIARVLQACEIDGAPEANASYSEVAGHLLDLVIRAVREKGLDDLSGVDCDSQD